MVRGTILSLLKNLICSYKKWAYLLGILWLFWPERLWILAVGKQGNQGESGSRLSSSANRMWQRTISRALLLVGRCHLWCHSNMVTI